MAITNTIKTLSVGLAWMWELFPYNEVYPQPNEFQDSAVDAPPLSESLTGSTSSFLNGGDVFASVAGAAGVDYALSPVSLAVVGPGEAVTLGIKAFNFSRSKNSPDNIANITVVGTPPKNAYPGVWCCLTSVDLSTNKKRVRFIGQIASANYSYTTQPNGLVTTQSTFLVREWSSMLRVPVRMESHEMSANMYGNNSASAIDFANKVIGENVGQGIVTAAYNPFLMAVLVLQMLGAISNNNSLSTIKALADKNYYQVASRMPVIPPALLKRLNLHSLNSSLSLPSSTQSSDPLNSFANGFVQFINGIRTGDTDPKLSDGTWQGVFGVNGTDTIDDFKQEYSSVNTGRPVADNVGFLISMNIPAWDILTTHCDPSYNEFFTDLYYETNGEVEKAQPVFVFRDKPFLLDQIKTSIGNPDFNKFSLYDDLPRVRLEPASIMAFNFSNTILNSANLIRISWTDQFTNPDAAKQSANANGYNLLLPEMLRFGGQEKETHTNFVSFDTGGSGTDAAGNAVGNGFSSASWWALARDITTAWYAYDYRFGSGLLIIKDYNVPISVGHNVQFDFGNFTFVGHVESLNFSVEVDAKGNVQNSLRISLIKIVQVDENDNLVFIRPDQFGALASNATEPIPGDPVSYPNSPSASQLISELAGS